MYEQSMSVVYAPPVRRRKQKCFTNKQANQTKAEFKVFFERFFFNLFS